MKSVPSNVIALLLNYEGFGNQNDCFAAIGYLLYVKISNFINVLQKTIHNKTLVYDMKCASEWFICILAARMGQ